MTNVFEYLVRAVERDPEKIAFCDPDRKVTYREAYEAALCVAAQLNKRKLRSPIPFLMEKSVETVELFLGAAGAGCCYSLLDTKHPTVRLNQILETLEPEILVTDERFLELAQKTEFAKKGGNVVLAEELLQGDAKEVCIAPGGKTPLYINFTSGSTGVPKGVAVGHASVIRFIDCFTEICEISDEDIIGNQAPFDFDVSVKDLYATIATGATMVIIPKKLFSFPTKLLDYLEEYQITTLIWAVSALTMITSLKGFDYKVPGKIRKVIFSGEVMPVTHLNQWREVLPDAQFINVYGPTEITCNCTYYKIERAFSTEEVLPIGIPFPDGEVFLLDEQNQVIPFTGEQSPSGEICVAGECLALGYYHNQEQTEKAFVPDPRNKNVSNVIYRTGDLGYYLPDGNLGFIGRKDFQIKHMGHRIELSEIELAIDRIEGIGRCCVLYKEEEQLICAYYEGNVKRTAIIKALREQLPVFMVPNKFYQLETLPLNKNGKIDRAKLRTIE